AAGTVALRGALHHEWAAGRAERVPDATARPERHAVEATRVGVGPPLALTAPTRVHQVRIDREDVGGVDAQLLAGGWQVAGEEDVGVHDEPLEERVAGVGGEVDRDV